MRAGSSGIHKFRAHITAVVLTIILAVAAQFFTTAFNRLNRKEGDLEHFASQSRLLERNQREQAQKRRAFAHVKKFINHAKTFGLERHKWDHYDVNIEEKLYFPEARRILTQTANSESCYFHPISLHIKKIEEPAPMTSGQAQATAGSEKDQQRGDLLLSLKGTFIVRQR